MCVTGCNADRSDFKMPPDSPRITFRCDSSMWRARMFHVLSNDTHSECSTLLKSDHFSCITQLLASLSMPLVVHGMYVCVYVL